MAALALANRSPAQRCAVSLTASRRWRSATNWCSVALCSRRGQFRGNLLGQRPPQFLNGRVAGDDRLAKCSLLPIQPFSQSAFSSSNWQSRRMSARLAAPTRCESICTSPNASRITARDRRRMGQRGPIRTRNLAAPHSVAPERTDAFLGSRFGKLVDREAMTFIERLVQQLGRLVVASGEADRGAVQFMVRAVRRRDARASSGPGAVQPWKGTSQ